MIHVIYGDDVDSRFSKLQDLLKKNNSKPLEIFDDTTFSLEHFVNIVHGFGLFEEEKVLVFKNVLSSDVFGEDVIHYFDDMDQSNHIFIFSDRGHESGVLKKLKKKEFSCIECSVSKTEKQKYNIFTITNHLERFDKKNMWLELHRAVEDQHSFESLAGILLWKIKSMLVSGRTFMKNGDELRSMYVSLVDVYHQSRLGSDAMSLLESWVLDRV
jgi:hypothetical protein